ncbi:MAG: cysteine desulfurase NifS [Deltaproteobacteria bacterium]|jgi:cysteine desulfurase|nr:cysteine desulfurase NifS [Deltaproteobacteria bacterium]
MSHKLVYFDNNATTAVAPEVLEAMLPYLKEEYGNPSSMYSFAGNAQHAVQKARKQVAALLGATPDEIIFTACGTESDSTAIYSALEAQPSKRHFITTRVEHPAVLAVGQHLETKGCRVTFLGVDGKGRLDIHELEDALSADTALVSIIFANNETGNINPLDKIAALCKKRGVLLHTDAVQAIGKLPVNLAELPVDYLSLSGHKLHAPKGIGALYVRRGTPFRPFLRGGHQEHGRRSGTEAVPSIVALGKACELAAGHIEEENVRVRALRDRLESRIIGLIPDSIINGNPEYRLPGTTNVAFKYIEGEAILLMLNQYNICASSGSACTSGNLEPSHVLRAMGVPFTFAHGSIRLSLGRYNTEEEVDYAVEKLVNIVRRLREISPYRASADEKNAGCDGSCGCCN